MTLQKRIFRGVGTAIADYRMIGEGDRILVCLSGGKDSWVLTYVLEALRKKAPVHFEIEAVKVDYPHTAEENGLIAEACAGLGVPFHLITTEIAQIVAEKQNPEKSHCAFCARLRRGFIYTEAKRLGFGKIALGHHREDTNETLLMNLFFSGNLKAMPPVMRNDEDQITVIRPLLYVAEEDLREMVAVLGLPIVHEVCPYADDRQRTAMKALLKQLSGEYPNLQNSMLSAQGNVTLSHLHDLRQYDFEKISEKK